VRRDRPYGGLTTSGHRRAPDLDGGPAVATVLSVRRDLANARMGQLVGADGRTYAIDSPRIDSREIESLIESGCPVVTYFPGGRLVWHDEDDAWPAWADARSAAESVTAGRWQSPDDATAVVLVWHD
jgi:hypothetical protein